MSLSVSVRTLICLFLVLAAIVGSFLTAPGIRHRHDGGDHAHSHSGDRHIHSHGHSHPHRHSDDHHESDRDVSGKREGAVDEPSSHIHFSILGFEFTLPDFLNDTPAPLVASDPAEQHETSQAGDVVRLPSPFSLAQVLHVTLHWTAIAGSGIQPEGTDNPFCRAVVASDSNPGLDRSAPPLPPPRAQ